MIRQELLVRDLAFLVLAEDDRLAELGYSYGNISHGGASDSGRVDESVDQLVMTWLDGRFAQDDVVRQRVCLTVVGPAVRASTNLHQEILGHAGQCLLTRAAGRGPIKAVTLSRPRVLQKVGAELVTVGFDVYSRAAACTPEEIFLQAKQAL